MIARLRRWLREIIITLVLLAVVLLAMDWLRAPQAPADFADTPLHTLDGQTLSIQQLSASKPLLVYFWASWCSICRFTTPSVQTLYQHGGNVITVAYRSGNGQQVSQWLANRDYHLPVINDPSGQLTAQWHISATPVFVIVYRGQVITSTTGWTSGWGIRLRLWLAGFK